MIKDVMTSKPERNSIWVFAHDAPDQPRRYAGAAGRDIAGVLFARVHLMASKVRGSLLLPFLSPTKPLPLLSHFGPKRFEAGIGC
jgi:hypothetical protein